MTDFSPPSDLGSPDWLDLTPRFLPSMCSMYPQACSWFILSGPSPSAAFLVSFSSLFGSMPSGTSFRAMSFLVHCGFQGSFLKQSSYLHGASILVGAGAGRYGQVHNEGVLPWGKPWDMGRVSRRASWRRFLGELEESTHSFCHFTEPLCIKGLVTVPMAGKHQWAKQAGNLPSQSL